MKLLDRTQQRDLLCQLAEAYPNPINDLFDPEDLDSPESVNLHYLEEHGLVQLVRSDAIPQVLRQMHQHGYNPTPVITGGATITAAGMDFIQADGGLSAILGTVTVRLHADTIRDLVEAKIAASDEIPQADKPRLVEALKAMPEEGLKQLTQRLVGYGLDQAPGAWQAVLQMLN
ncbi:hypothetical protein EQG41_20760 [Billgrantia azerbaijanica]|nr:hypothetical protein EQG41_20760 [Halomonas azerbaijanica]